MGAPKNSAPFSRHFLALDPMLEKHIGKRIVLEITTGTEEIQEYVGIFKDYSQQFLQVMDVSYPDSDQERLCDIIAPRAHASIRHGAEASHRSS